MEQATSKPVIFLAFANDRDDSVGGFLRHLAAEKQRIRDVLEQAERDELCKLIIRVDCTADEIFELFQNSQYRNRIAIFHFGGHANSYQLLLESSKGHAAAVNAGGMAAFFAQQRGLQLVFLNGCSTQQQTQALLDANIPAVISTSRLIDDQVATDFASHFYRGLVGSATIRTAFNEAEAAVRTVTGDNMRALYFGNQDDVRSPPEADRWPWNLYVREGSERADQWNLPAAANNPLFGLPQLPHQDLPETPYRYLHWFTRKDAEVFFGRGHQIRELYHQLTAPRTAPIILLYGQSGVGKSSILEAGLIPRLEREHDVYYLRRRAGGLLDTLQLAFLPEASDVPIESAWRTKEEQTGKPLIVFLDQVEELYTRPFAELPDEVDQLLEAVKATFADIDRRPRGKLVLGFRKEWLPELEAKLSEYQLPRNNVFLEPLDSRGIVEVVRGPTRSARLHEKYKLTIEDDLPPIIANDLLADRGSAIAPTLQILLTKMWTEARKTNDEQPHFSRDLYQKLKRDGVLLRDFLNQQIAAIREQYREAADSGLLLDILALHTTPRGTADQCTVQELQEQYHHVGAVLPDLLRQCKRLHLLTEVPGTQKESAMRLAHDTLAPLVRERLENSDKPGQRARRILDNRAAEWEGDRGGTPLDEADLAIVEQGIAGTRRLSPVEQRLVEASRAQRHRRRRTRAFLGVAGAASVALILLLAALFANSYVERLELQAANREQRRLTDAFTTVENYGTLSLKQSRVKFISVPTDDEAIRQLVEALRALEITELDFGSAPGSDELLGKLATLTALQQLNLSGSAQITNFSPLSKLTNLKSLDLSGTRFRDVQILKTLETLRYLVLNSTPIQEFVWEEHCPHLEEVSLRKALELDEITVRGHQGLKILDIEGCGAERLELRDLPQLEELNATDVQRLSELELPPSTLPELETLAITASKLRGIELVGFKHLDNVNVANSPQLESVSIQDCGSCRKLVIGGDVALKKIELNDVHEDIKLEDDRRFDRKQITIHTPGSEELGNRLRRWQEREVE